MKNKFLAKSDEILKLQMNFDLYTDRDEILNTLRLLNLKLEQIKKLDFLFYRKEIVSKKFSGVKFTILDFEGDPTILMGIFVANQILQLYIKDQRYQGEFFNQIMDFLSELRDFYVFSFSNYEIRVLNEILRYVNAFRAKKYLFVRNLKLVNVQKFSYEGLIPALYSIGKKVYDDPLLRESKNVNLHFKKGHYGLILDHNKSCLLSILELAKNRYLKEILI